MADTIEQLMTVYGSRIPFDNELSWLKLNGASAGTNDLEFAWREVLTANGYWTGDFVDSYTAWLQAVTGLTTTDTNVLLMNALDNNVYAFVRTFGELVQFFHRESSVDENGKSFAFNNLTDYAQMISPCISGNNSNAYVELTGQTQVITDTVPLIINMRVNNVPDGNNNAIIDTRTDAFENGVIIFFTSAGNITVFLAGTTGNNRFYTFTSSTNDLIEREFHVYKNSFSYYEEGVLVATNAGTLTGTIADINNTNQILLMQRTDLTGITPTQSTYSDFRMRNTVSGDWDFHFPFAEGAGNTHYCVLGSGLTMTSSNITHTVNIGTSHHNSRYGFYFDGTRNVPALLSNNLVDALGNPIDMDLTRLNDTFAQVDFDPLGSYATLPNTYQIGDLFNGAPFSDKRVIGDAEDRFLHASSDISGEAGYDTYMDDVA